MPRQKDLKRHVRARMQKTGESYTAARAQVRAQPRPAVRPTVRPAVELPPDPEKRAGMSDAAVSRKTGRTWAGWIAVLDRAGARAMSHRDIARHLHEAEGVPAWWSQMVAVGYERLRGLRGLRQRREGDYEASKSRTFPVSVARLYAAFAEPRRRARWLAQPGVRVTTKTANRSVRFAGPDGTRFHAWFVVRGPSKSRVQVQQEKLRDPEEVARVKTLWGQRFDALAALLENSPGS